MRLRKFKILIKKVLGIGILLLCAAGFVRILRMVLLHVITVQLSWMKENPPELLLPEPDREKKDVLPFRSEVHDLLVNTMDDVVASNKIPKNFLVKMKEKRKEFEYQLQPERIIGKHGLLATREFQGNTWSGVLMKGALVFFVQSTASHYRRRMLLRSTWASIRDIDSFKFETVFVLSPITSKKKQALLVAESEKYQDILQYTGGDRNNSTTNKAIAGLQWSTAVLPGDFLYAFVTDDTLVNLSALHNFLSVAVPYLPPPGNVYTVTATDGSAVTSSQKQNIYCLENFRKMEAIERDFNSTRSVSNETYDAEFWPPYCTEGLYIIPISFAKELYEVSRQTAFNLPDDLHDVLTTGILRGKLNRGDTNISPVVSTKTGKFLIKRFQMLSPSSQSQVTQEEQNVEKRFHLTWSEIYDLLRTKFHIYSPFKDNEAFGN